MKRIRIVWLCLVAVFAFNAVAVASASAEGPEYMTCVKKKGGNYEKGCATKAALAGTGKAELEPVVPGTKFTSKSKGATFAIGTKVVKCKKDTDEGEFTGGPYDKEKMTFSGCGINGNKKEPCGTVGAAAGTIETNKLESVLEWLSEAEKTDVGVGLDGTGAGFKWAEFSCGSEKITIVGAVLGKIENNKKGEKITFVVEGGLQEPTTYWEAGIEEEAPSLSAGAESVTFATVDEQGPKGVGAY